MFSIFLSFILALVEIFFPFIVFFVAIYFFAVYAYKMWKKRNGIAITISESRQYINGLIKNVWDSWTKPPEPPEPLASDIFIATLKNVFSDVSAVDVALIPYEFGLNYSGLGVPFVAFKVLSNVDAATMRFTCQKLEETANNFLLMSNYQSPLVRAHFEKYGDFHYHVVLLYSVFLAAKERLMVFQRTKATIQESVFTRENQPVLNPDLEKELDAMEKEEQEEKKDEM